MNYVDDFVVPFRNKNYASYRSMTR